MLGVPVHVAHDTATLADLLQLFGGRKLVLIDTAGLGQRDQRVEMLLRALDAPQVRRLLVLNATASLVPGSSWAQLRLEGEAASKAIESIRKQVTADVPIGVFISVIGSPGVVPGGPSR